ncbi:MAG: XisI protein [Anaerolineaceae bacterium 4572_78]|nr:MAG: XisI protein [Anaerolineaceae bacterium 4572_78]
MDKLEQYRTLIKQLLRKHESLSQQNRVETIETHLLFDDEHGRYMLFDTGWWHKKRIRTPTLYVRLYNDKIWIEEDWTEEGIATELVHAGIAKTDIVLSFHPPEIQPFTEFAKVV